MQPVHPKGDQSWVFIGRTDAEAETLIFWPPDAKNGLIGKDPMLEKTQSFPALGLFQRTDSLEKTQCWERLKAGGEGDDRG